MTEITHNSDWTGIRSTSKLAKPVSYRSVENRLVVKVEQSFFRGSHFKNCFFEVSDKKEPIDTYAGKQRIQVKVLWFGRKPKTTWAHITLVGNYELIYGYTGDVVNDFGV